MFFTKSKEVILDCFTYVPYVYDYAKIDHAGKFIPEWWKQTPNFTENGSATIRNCPAFIEFYKNGIVIPSWFEMELRILESGNPDLYIWNASNPAVSTDTSHNKSQFAGFAEEDGNNVKFTSPWGLRTKEDISFTWTQPTWNLKAILGDLTLLPAVINFKYQHSTEINFLIINKDQPKKIHIPSLTPLVMLHPLTDKKITLKHHLVDEKEWQRLRGVDYLFFKRGGKDSTTFYNKKKKLINNIEDQSKKCPFRKFFS